MLTPTQERTAFCALTDATIGRLGASPTDYSRTDPILAIPLQIGDCRFDLIHQTGNEHFILRTWLTTSHPPDRSMLEMALRLNFAFARVQLPAIALDPTGQSLIYNVQLALDTSEVPGAADAEAVKVLMGNLEHMAQLARRMQEAALRAREA